MIVCGRGMVLGVVYVCGVKCSSCVVVTRLCSNILKG